MAHWERLSGRKGRECWKGRNIFSYYFSSPHLINFVSTSFEEEGAGGGCKEIRDRPIRRQRLGILILVSVVAVPLASS
jgi:hypothetical protein